MIRIILVAIFIILFFIISIPIWIVELIIGKINRHAHDISCLRIVQFAFKCVLFISGTKTNVTGLENIPKDEPVLFVGNHQGIFDTVIAYSMMPNLTGFVAKKEIEKVPFLRVWMRLLYCLFLDRQNMKEGLKTILKGIELVKDKGISMVIFPEGTRSKTEEMGPFKEGALKIAEKSGCKIIPMAQKNTRAILENQYPRIKKAHTAIAFGKPIDISTLTKEEKKFLGAYVQNIIKEMYQELDVEYETVQK